MPSDQVCEIDGFDAESESSVLADLLSEVPPNEYPWELFMCDRFVGWVHWAIHDDDSTALPVKRVRPRP